MKFCGLFDVISGLICEKEQYIANWARPSPMLMLESTDLINSLCKQISGSMDTKDNTGISQGKFDGIVQIQKIDLLTCKLHMEID